MYEHHEERDWSAVPTDDRVGQLESMIKDLLLALHHLHSNKYLTHGNITPASIVYDGHRFKLKHWALNFVTENGSLLDSDALFPDDVSFPDFLFGHLSIRYSFG